MQTNAKIYYNGDILTLEDNLYTDAVLIQDGIIKALGSKEELLKCSQDAELIDLKGNTLMPSFIDPHSHFIGFAMSKLQVSVKEAESFNEIQDLIKKFIKDNKIPEGKWITVNNFDEHDIKEGTYPNKSILDEASPKNPLIIQHMSGHSGLLNSLGLKEFGLTSETPNPEGGKIYKDENNEPTGVLEENAYINLVQKIPMPSIEEIKNAVLSAEKIYASYGITTVQEGMVVNALAGLIKYLKDTALLNIDYIGYIDLKNAKDAEKLLSDCIKKYKHHVKIGGYKIFLDGSPQSCTAYMLENYKNGKNGYPIYKDDELKEKIETAVKENMQLLAHCNGDAACLQYINCYREVKERYHESNIRPVIIHAQLLNKDQLKNVKELQMIPSFFIAHVYHFGDIHINNFGKDRASSISPAKSALDNGIIFTFHQDSPVIEPNMLETIWCAVNRITKSGLVLGEDEKISPLDAIKAVTKNAAFQYFEENLKGSIALGKLADLVILNCNPLKCSPESIKNIEVLETIKEGNIIYKK